MLKYGRCCLVLLGCVASAIIVVAACGAMAPYYQWPTQQRFITLTTGTDINGKDITWRFDANDVASYGPNPPPDYGFQTLLRFKNGDVQSVKEPPAKVKDLVEPAPLKSDGL